MRAVLVATDFPPGIGGIQEALHQILLQVGRMQIEVVAPNAPGAEEFDAGLPFRVHRVGPVNWPDRGGGPARLAALSAATLARARRSRAQLVICGHPFLAPAGLAAQRLLGLPYVVLAYGMELLHRPQVLRASLHRADLVLAISSHTRAMVAALGVPEDRIRVVALGVDPSLGSPGALGAGWADRPGEGARLLTVARMDELYKGHDVILRALPLILAKVPAAQWWVVGDGALRPYYQAMARALGVADHVHFTGTLSRAERDAQLAACDLLVMVSRDRPIDGGGEGFGLVYLEANLFGKPVLAGRAGGVPDVVVDGETGRLVDPEDVLEVAEAAIEMLGDPALRERLGKQGRQRAEADFTWRSTAAAFEDAVIPLAGHRRTFRRPDHPTPA